MMKDSSEVISDEDLLNKIDKLNNGNKDWQPDPEKVEPIGDSKEMTDKLTEAPGLCGCEDCHREGNGSGDYVGEEQVHGAGSVGEEHDHGACSVGEKHGQGAGSVGEKHDQGAGRVGEEHGQGAGSVGEKKSVKGKRNLSLLLREKREQLRQKRTNKFKRCDRVSSKDVSQEWVQDKSKVMVVIGSDAVSLYPSMTKQESANEVADAVMESSLKWEGVNWKEATRYLALGRDEAWCRSSDLYRVLPWRKHKQGSRPGLTGVGPMGAGSDDEN